MDACTGPFGVYDQRRVPVAASSATTCPVVPKEPPPTITESPTTAGEDTPASTAVSQARVPVARSIAYTLPSLDGAMSREPAMAGDAATEPPVSKNHRSAPVEPSRARTP